MCSIHSIPLLKPACSPRSLSSTASDRLFMMTFVRILLGVENTVMPHQLLHSGRAPFFGILTDDDTLIPVIRDFPSVPYGCKMLAVDTASALNSSALRRSLTGALCLFRELMAAMIPSFFGGPVSTLRSSTASGKSGSSSSAGLLWTSLKFSTLYSLFFCLRIGSPKPARSAEQSLFSAAVRKKLGSLFAGYVNFRTGFK